MTTTKKPKADGKAEERTVCMKCAHYRGYWRSSNWHNDCRAPGEAVRDWSHINGQETVTAARCRDVSGAVEGECRHFKPKPPPAPKKPMSPTAKALWGVALGVVAGTVLNLWIPLMLVGVTAVLWRFRGPLKRLVAAWVAEGVK